MFGKDLNRKQKLSYDSLLGKFDNIEGKKKINDLERQLDVLLKDNQDMDIVEDVLDAKANGKDTEEFYIKLIAKLKGHDTDSDQGNAGQTSRELQLD